MDNNLNSIFNDHNQPLGINNNSNDIEGSLLGILDNTNQIVFIDPGIENYELLASKIDCSS